MPGNQGLGAGDGERLFRQPVQEERRGQTALPDRPAIKGWGAPAKLPVRIPAPYQCTSHLGFGLGAHLSTFEEAVGLGYGTLIRCFRGTPTLYLADGPGRDARQRAGAEGRGCDVLAAPCPAGASDAVNGYIADGARPPSGPPPRRRTGCLLRLIPRPAPLGHTRPGKRRVRR